MTVSGLEVFFSPLPTLLFIIIHKVSQIDHCLLHEVLKVIHSYCNFSGKEKKILVFVSP